MFDTSPKRKRGNHSRLSLALQVSSILGRSAKTVSRKVLIVSNTYESTAAMFSRREAACRMLAGTAGLVIGSQLELAGMAAAPAPHPRAKAKAVIQIWMWGGPPHTDTFDPKPAAGYDYRGPFEKPIATNVPGIQINELLPNLARQADKYSILRGMTHGIFAHETASYATQTGRMPGGREVYPGVGAVVSLFRGYAAGYKGLVPPYIVLTVPQGRFSEAGFLGIRYKPFATGGDPSQARFVVEGVVAQNISDERQKYRRELLKELNSLQHAAPHDPRLVDLQDSENQAYDLILGDAGKVFDLSQEKDDVRERYGRNKFGQSCLMARRLVERGVRYITINDPGWDTHKQNFQTMRRKLPVLDKGMSSLLQDLADRGLLESTIVWWTGEFGRKPKVDWDAPWNGGRNHWGNVFSAVVAGGGFKGGHVIGASDAKGEELKERPVYPCDVIGSIYDQLGIDTEARLPHPMGLVARVTPSPADGILSGGRLREIM